jgi:hypothetical protein
MTPGETEKGFDDPDSLPGRLGDRWFPPSSKRSWLTLLAILQLTIVCVIAFLSERFAPETSFETRPVFLFVGLMTAGFGFYLLSLLLVWNGSANSTGKWWNQPATLSVLVWAIVFRAVLLFSEPIQEIDIYRYIWDGRVTVQGISPYRHAPADVMAASGENQAGSSLERLAKLKDEAPPIGTILARVHFPEVRTIYPPASQLVFAGVALVTSPQASVRSQIRIMKAVLLLFDVGSICLLMAILASLGLPPARALAYAWCPLVLKEFANSGHLDSIAVFLVLLTFRFLLSIRSDGTRSDRENQGSSILAAVAWSAATLAKLYPAVLVPVIGRYLFARMGRRALVPLTLYLLLTAAFLLAPRSTPEKESGRSDVSEAGENRLEGAQVFFGEWEINDLVFMFTYENLRVRRKPADTPWFVIVPESLRRSTSDLIAKTFARWGIQSASPAFVANQLLVGGLLIAVCWSLALRRSAIGECERLLQGTFLSLACLWYLSATQNPWYWTWALPFAVFARNPTWLLVPGFAMIYYLRFGLIYKFESGAFWTLGLSGQRFFDEGLVWLEHLPIGLLLFGSWLIRRRFELRKAVR